MTRRCKVLGVLLAAGGMFLAGTAVARPAAAPGGVSVIPAQDVIDLNAAGSPPMLYNQGFRAQDCSFEPRGINPYFDPLVPGFRFVTRNPTAHDPQGRPGVLVKTTTVLPSTEKFRLPGIGSFEAAVIEEREVFEGKLIQISMNWYAICEETGNIFTFGENSFQLDPDTGAVVDTTGTWRAGEVNSQGEVAIPALTMPASFLLGSRYIFDGAPGVAFGGAENVGVGLGTVGGMLTTVPTDFYGGQTVHIPATRFLGQLRGCGQVEEISQDSDTRLPDFGDPTNKVWCPGVGLVYDTSDGALVETNIRQILRAGRVEWPSADGDDDGPTNVSVSRPGTPGPASSRRR